MSLFFPPIQYGTNLKRLGYATTLISAPFLMLALCEGAMYAAGVSIDVSPQGAIALVAVSTLGALGYCALRCWGRAKVRAAAPQLLGSRARPGRRAPNAPPRPCSGLTSTAARPATAMS